MKVILTTPTYPPFNSGLGNAVIRQAKALASRGCDVVVATGGDVRSTETDAHNIRIERFAVTGSDYLRNPIRGDARGYMAFLTEEPYDALVLNAWQTWSTDLPLANLKRLKGRKFVYSHCISTNMWLPYIPIRSLAFWLLWRPYWWALPKRMAQLDGVIFLAENGDDSRFDDLKLARQLNVPVYVVPNSVEHSVPVDDSFERNQIISVGSFTKAKGFDFVIEAYARSSAKNVLPLVLFGQEFTPYADELKKSADALGVLTDMLIMRAGVAGDQLIREYKLAKLFLFGSYTECQPLVILDAMATGTPFVARKTGCISELSGGYAVANGAEAVVRINTLMSSPTKWNTLSLDGQRSVQRLFSTERNANELVRILRGEAAAYDV